MSKYVRKQIKDFAVTNY